MTHKNDKTVDDIREKERRIVKRIKRKNKKSGYIHIYIIEENFKNQEFEETKYISVLTK